MRSWIKINNGDYRLIILYTKQKKTNIVETVVLLITFTHKVQ